MEVKTIESLLVVEDNRNNSRMLTEGVMNLAPMYFPHLETVGHVMYEDELEGEIPKGYDIVLLDHCLPEPIGYTLIDKFKEANPNSHIIGTSSAEKELEGMPRPEYSIRKNRECIQGDLEKVFREISNR